MTKGAQMNKRMVLVVAGLGAAVACVVAGAVVAAQFNGSLPPDPEAIGRAIESAPMIKVAEIEAADDKPARGVFVQLTDTGHVCIWDARSASARQRQGGCNRAEDPLGGSAVSASLAYDGGPAIETVRDARLTGLASAETASLQIVMSDGSNRAIKLEKAKVGADEFQAFGYRVRKSDLKRGIGPTAVVAFDASGIELGRQPTGIGG